MKIQIRLAESGHSHCYQNVPNMEFLMQEIKRDFKIQINNQKILNKSSELMKKQTNFDSVKQNMKKTISSQNNYLNNNLSEFNNQKKQNADRQILQFPCLYVYNQKQLLKPIQYTDSKDKEYFLGVLTKKMEEMMSLREQPYELNQIKERIVKNHLQEAVQYVSKKHKTIQKNLNIYEKYKNFLESAKNCNELSICVGELTNLCESQCKAGKTIIRSINVINHQKCKRKLENITKKLESIKKYSLPSQDQMNFKQNSIYFNSSKKLSIQALSSILSKKEVLDKKFIQGQQKYKKAKKAYVVQKYKFGQKKCYQISISLQKLKHTLQEISMQLKHSYNEFFEQLQKFVKKQIKQSTKLVLILQKISTDEQKISTILQKLTQFYLQLSQIHNYNEKVQIKQVYAAYVGLRKYFDEFQDEIKDLQRELYRYMKQIEQKQKCQKGQKSQKFYEVDEFISSQTIEDKEKQNQRDNKRQKVSSPKKDSTLKEKQKQNNLPKMMSSPSKKKIAKNNIKFLSQQCIQNKSKNKSKNQVQIQQIDKRLFFNRRIKNVMTFCQNLREDEQKRRKKYKDNNKFYEIINMNKEKERQSSQILKNTTTPIFVMDYDSTTDQNLESLRKILLNQNQKLKQFSYSPQTNIYTWQEEIINTISCVNLQLNVFIATAKIDESARQNHLKKLLQLSTGLITKMCKKKLFYQKQQFIKNVNSQYEEQLSKLRKQNQSLNFYIVSLKESIQNSDNINQNDRESEEEKQQRDKNESKLSLDRFFQIQKNVKYLSEVNEQVQTQNKLLKDQIVKLNENLFKYQQEIDQITNQLARLEERDQEVQQLKQQLQHEDINKKNIQEEMQKNHYQFENEKAVHLKQVEQLKHHLNMEKQNAFALKKQIKQILIYYKIVQIIQQGHNDNQGILEGGKTS